MTELGKAFEPSAIEKKWYSSWISHQCFSRKAPKDGQKSFSILMPPPNVTGVLHMGHLLNQTLQDFFCRRARHEGKNVTWVVGTDHAGISMQVKVEKELAKSGISRKEIGREAFLKHAYQWRDDHGGIILKQLESLGVSCDFEHKVHTLDADYSHAVLTAFVELYKKGYIYRGQKMVNWCPKTLTALSDEEVIMTPQKTKLYYVRYELVERPGTFLTVATTRPETIPGDVAIAVNPSDERYRDFVGLHITRPLNPIAIPIIADDVVDKEFGTGALKITPAHAKVDFEVGQRHHLPFVDVLNPDGTMNALSGADLEGLDTLSARKKSEQLLNDLHALVKTEDYDHHVGISERGNVPVEPRLSEQWFLKYPMVEEAKRAVMDGIIQFFPKHWEKTYLYWLDNIHDWCISRQLWWGHRIPVWYRKGCDRHDPQNWYVGVKAPEDSENWEQDEDVLDTWASSWLWPLGVFGWPNHEDMKHKFFDAFYPTSVLVTGPDIIFFWVARMIIAGLTFLSGADHPLSSNEIAQYIPFKSVYFTGIIRDKLGRKMSKSLGNSPDPIDMIQKYGADGLRFGLLMSAPSGQDLIFNEDNMALGRNFCNKLWNAFRLVHLQVHDAPSFAHTSVDDLIKSIVPEFLSPVDHAMFLQLLSFQKAFEHFVQQFEINAAITLMYNFFWNEYCSWYLEISKTKLHNGETSTIAIHRLILRQLLLLLNPIIPFITEELWQAGTTQQDDITFIQDALLESSESLSQKLSHLDLNTAAIEEVELIKELISTSRGLLSDINLSKHAILHLFISAQYQPMIQKYLPWLPSFLNVSKVFITTAPLPLPSKSCRLGIIFLENTQQNTSAIDIQKTQEEIAKLDKLIALNQAKLENKTFTDKAPLHVVEGARKLLAENLEKREKLLLLINSIKNLN